MVKCPYAKEGESCFGHDYKNKVTLAAHVVYKHKNEKLPKPEPQPEPTKEELGLDNPPAAPDVENKQYCSECGADFEGKPDECPNCGEKFEEEE